MKYIKRMLVAGLVLQAFAVGCNEGNERLLEQARLEGQQAAREGVEAENENLRRRAAQMEEDLERRHRFFEAISGLYEGILTSPSGDRYSIRITFSPSLPRYPESNRARTLEELSFELNELHLNAHVVEWLTMQWEEPTDLASGCAFEGIRPDLIKGTIFLVSRDCEKSYTLYLSELDPATRAVVAQEYPVDLSRSLASRVVAGQLPVVEGLTGMRQSSLSSRRFGVTVRKTAR